MEIHYRRRERGVVIVVALDGENGRTAVLFAASCNTWPETSPHESTASASPKPCSQ